MSRAGGLFWASPGGDYFPNASATAWVNASTNTVVFQGPGMVSARAMPPARRLIQRWQLADVLAWQDDPLLNRGWLVRAVNESLPGSEAVGAWLS
jgi:hypothetical protein